MPKEQKSPEHAAPGVPRPLKFLAILILCYSLWILVQITHNFVGFTFDALNGNYYNYGTSSLVCIIIFLATSSLTAIASAALCLLLFLGRRKAAARFIFMLYGLLGTLLVTHVMIYGVSLTLNEYFLSYALLIILQIYLDPHLREERKRERKRERQAEDERWREEQLEGTLGFDESGRGAIDINFFNLFWIFVVCSVLGLLIEEVYHFVFVVPGEWQDRAGVLFGPFSPIYGFGAVIMSVMLNRLHKSPVLVIFVASALIGGVFEAAVGYFMEFSFGAVAWDYSNEVLPLFGGRTCLKFMIMWGFMGAAWLKIFMPAVVKFVNKIPWNWRYVLTTVSAVLMLVDGIMTLQSLDCWYMRVSSVDAVETPISEFYAQNFDNDYMEARFESMTITPDTAIRG